MIVVQAKEGISVFALLCIRRHAPTGSSQAGKTYQCLRFFRIEGDLAACVAPGLPSRLSSLAYNIWDPFVSGHSPAYSLVRLYMICPRTYVIRTNP